jgi:stage II sporulation protein D
MMRARVVLIAVAGTLLLAGSASAASTFYIRGGGNGHGIGMSQYGAYGYALHGKDYRFILAHYYQGTALGLASPNRIVRVLLSTGGSTFNGATRASGKQLQRGTTYHVNANADGSLTLLDQSGTKVGRFGAPLTVSGSGPLEIVGKGLHRGSLELRPDGSGGVQTVEAVGLDDYVRGVISGEMPASWSSEALKTQAVAARTYAITTNVGGASFDVYPDTRSQMYGGVAAETQSTDAAVAATSGQIVTYHGVPAVTYFFASSGGYTENVENVWPGATAEPWLRGVPDPYDGAGGDPYHGWGDDLSIASAATRLAGFVKGAFLGIQVMSHGVSPRVLSADVVGTRGRVRVTGTQLQQVFGLLTTDATFTTISTVPVQPSMPQLIAGAAVRLQGSIFPGPKGAPLAIQTKVGGAWRTIVRARLAAGGRYSAQVPGSGAYRVTFGGLNGPVVNVS